MFYLDSSIVDGGRNALGYYVCDKCMKDAKSSEEASVYNLLEKVSTSPTRYTFCFSTKNANQLVQNYLQQMM